MKRVCSFGLTVVVALASLTWLNVGTALARKQYKDEFVKKYVTEEPSTPAQKKLDSEVKAVNCGICHLGPKGAKKKEHKAYGTALKKLLEKNEKDADKIDTALDTLAKEPSSPDDAASPTYGDLLEKGKLPVPPGK